VSGLDELTREELVALVLKLREVTQAKDEKIAELEEEIARLRGGKSSAQLSIKPSGLKKEKGPRKKRKHSFSRKSLVADKVCYHALEVCPDCGRKLVDGSVKWRHQVKEIPPIKVEVTDHLFVERCCGVCGKRWTPDPCVVLADVVVGKKSVGVSLMSLIAHLKTVCRVPIGQTQKLLGTLYGLRISAGEIAEILHDVAEIGESEYDKLLESVRGSPVVHGDETGWREDGVNGYIWSFSTPKVRYYTYRRSRGSVVVKEVLSEFAGTLVTDFYAAYNIYDGLKQRCWVHLTRDLKDLKEKNPDMLGVTAWVDAAMDIYHRAKGTLERDYTDRERMALRQRFEVELLTLAKPYIGVKSAPQRVLAQRMERFISELFVFVQYPQVPSENNAAERAIRPAVVARKISGGTRSGKGSKTSSVLRSLFETWNLQERNTLDACQNMLVSYNRHLFPASR
jgi:transposase